MTTSSEPEQTTQPRITGSCACGKIKYTATCTSHDTFAFDTTHCYCTTCRKCSGAAYLPFTHFRFADVEWHNDKQPDTWRKQDFATRGFCATCGTCLTMSYDSDNETFGICVGTVDEGLEFVGKVEKAIFLVDKPDWAEVPAGIVRRYDAFHNAPAAL